MFFINQTKHSSNSQGSILVVSSNHGNTNTSTLGNFDSINTFRTGRIHDGTKTNNGEPRFTTFLHKFWTKLFSLLDRTLLKRTTSQSQHTETMRRQNSNLFNPVVLVTRFKIFFLEASTLGLVLAQRNHPVRSTLYMSNQFVVVIRPIILFNRGMNSGHELVFRTEGDFSNHGRTIFHSRHIYVSKVCGTEDGELSWVSNLTLAATIFSQAAFGTKDASTQGLAQEFRIRALSVHISEGSGG
mmetsp:Transcript_19646/g.40761  ORF Transcript_19646/g.40761 Transcript_19646/m.40761 type:complete len:242 (+) Transcript_19646:1322-2047(+)